MSKLHHKYSSTGEELKVSCVIFVASALDPVPKNLIQCVLDAARPSGVAGTTDKRSEGIYTYCLSMTKNEHNY